MVQLSSKEKEKIDDILDQITFAAIHLTATHRALLNKSYRARRNGYKRKTDMLGSLLVAVRDARKILDIPVPLLGQGDIKEVVSMIEYTLRSSFQ